jgi:putative glutamine amidotransferase
MAGLPVPDHPRHPIAPVPGTRLHELLGDEVVVNSFHHQAVDELGAGLAVSARAPDGVIEAIEMPGRFVLAMQCELHEEWRIEPRVQLVVEAFVAAAGDRVAV